MFDSVLNMSLKAYTTVGGCHCTRMKFSIKDFVSKCDQICSFLQILSHLKKKSLMKNFIFCAVCLAFLYKNKFTNLKFLARIWRVTFYRKNSIKPSWIYSSALVRPGLTSRFLQEIIWRVVLQFSWEDF